MSTFGFLARLPFAEQILKHLLSRLGTQQTDLDPQGADSLLGEEKVFLSCGLMVANKFARGNREGAGDEDRMAGRTTQ